MVDMSKRPHAKTSIPYDTDQRHDVVIVPTNQGFRLSDAAAKSIILNLATKYWIRPVDEVIAEDFVEVYCTHGPSSHEVFTPTTYDMEIPVFLEAAVYFGREAANLDYDGGLRVWFYLEFRGCVFKEPLAPLRTLFKDNFNIRIKTHHRLHAGLPPRREAE